MGEVTVEELVPTVADVDGPQPKDVAARLVAHIGHRIPGAKRLEKRLEGKELKSGILSDLAALGAQLYVRNQQLLDAVAEQAVAEGISKLTHRGPVTPMGGGGVIRDFGEVSPESNNNNGGME